jgi:hypothetical protein
VSESILVPATNGPQAASTRKRYTLTVNGEPRNTEFTYRDYIVGEARCLAYEGEPGTTTRVTDNRTGAYWEYSRGAGQYDLTSRVGVTR